MDNISAEKKAEELKHKIDQKKDEISKLGKWSWWLLNAQGLLFAMGFLFMGIAVILKILGY